MRQSDRDRIAARLAVLETRRQGDSGARERLAARLDGVAARLAPVAPGEALARLMAGLAAAPDNSPSAALRRIMVYSR